MANIRNKPNALALLLNYDSDSDRDSGYTSEEEKKRKQTFINPREKKNKKFKSNLEEEMAVDGESSFFENKRDHISLFRNDLNTYKDSDDSRITPKFKERRDLMPSNYQNMPIQSQR